MKFTGVILLRILMWRLHCMREIRYLKPSADLTEARGSTEHRTVLHGSRRMKCRDAFHGTIGLEVLLLVILIALGLSF